jgi:hypothetical protein
MRSLSNYFMRQLTEESGILFRIRSLVQQDRTLCMEIRGDTVNIYYRGGNVMMIEEAGGSFKASFDVNYVKDGSKVVETLPKQLHSQEHVSEWMNTLPILKHKMDLWFGCHSRDEREYQQLVVRENNLGKSAKSTDYFICDIEYALHGERYDMVAVQWVSSAARRKKSSNLRLAFIEVKYLDGALDGPAGLRKHVEDIDRFAGIPGNLKRLADEMKEVMNQKRSLGLVAIPKAIESIRPEKPEVILVLANQNPRSRVLMRELSQLPDCANVEVKIATSNHMGYGLYAECMHGLADFIARYSGRRGDA